MAANPMLRKLYLGLLAIGCLLTGAAGVVLNDGTSPANLFRLGNLNGSGGIINSTIPVGGGILQARQDGGVADFPLRNCWYARDRFPTNGVYKVSVDFKAADGVPECRGGVIGWINLLGRKAVALQVTPAGPNAAFQLSVVDFLATDPAGNDSVNSLFNLDGTPATADNTSAWSDLGAGYNATNFATFELEFKAPTVSELLMVTNATAHITAKVYQRTDGAGAALQVSRTIEMLTSLPLPDADKHRVGYYAYWGSIRDEGSTIGYLDNLTFDGQFGILINAAPLVFLDVTEPANFNQLSSLPSPSSLKFAVNSFDPDGRIAKLEIFSNQTNLLQTLTPDAIAFDWVNVGSGRYEITAVATDDAGASRTSSPPVVVIINSPPSATLTSPTEGAVIGAPGVVRLTSFGRDDDGSVVLVKYYNDTGLIASGTNAENNFSAFWTNSAVGTNSCYLIAYDNYGLSFTSSAVSVTFISNAAPAVSIQSPTNGSQYVSPASIAFRVNAVDSDGTIDHVELWEVAGNKLLASIGGFSPFLIGITNVPAGPHQYYSVAYDNLGGFTQSAQVAVVVQTNLIPTVTFTSPTSSGPFIAPATVSVSLTGTDPDGVVDKIYLTVNTNDPIELIGAPFATTLTALPVGSYTLTAVGVDHFGALSLPVTRSFTVTSLNPNTPPTLTVRKFGSNGFQVSWPTVYTTYRLFISIDGGTWTPVFGNIFGNQFNGVFNPGIKSFRFRLAR